MRKRIVDGGISVAAIMAVFWRRGLELIGFGFIIYAGWLVAEPLGFALAGMACLNFALGGSNRR